MGIDIAYVGRPISSNTLMLIVAYNYVNQIGDNSTCQAAWSIIFGVFTPAYAIIREHAKRSWRLTAAYIYRPVDRCVLDVHRGPAYRCHLAVPIRRLAGTAAPPTPAYLSLLNQLMRVHYGDSWIQSTNGQRCIAQSAALTASTLLQLTRREESSKRGY